MTYRAVVFDLDGTLLDTLEDLADSMNAVLAREGCPQHPVGEYRYLVGDGMPVLVRRALPPDRQDAQSIDRCVLAMQKEYARRWDAHTRPYPGVPAMLDGLDARMMPKAVLSNKPEDFARLTVARLLPRWRFDPVCGARPDVPRKPDPWGARAIAAHLGVEPERFLYVGDTNTDMRTARAAGMCAVGATWGFRPAAELEESGADHLLRRPVDLLELL
ncbi:MAG: HAD family hydrolase [Candidatus Latescibacterota bacterium]